jgi:Cof subfamily protein (haloacid dehalogenase superfamily)
MTLFVSDVDGTLVNRQAALSESTRVRLAALLEQGMPFTVASARSVASLRVMLQGLTLRLPVVEYNGAFTTCLKTGARPFVRSLAAGVADHIFGLAVRHGLRPSVSTFDGHRDRLFAGEPLNAGMQWYLDERVAFRDPRLTRTDDVRVGFRHQVVSLTFIATEAALSPLRDEILQHHRERVRINFYENQYSPGWHWLTVHHQRATKAVAVLDLCDRLGVSPSALTVFGDERNDIPMFQIAGKAVAVGNAHRALKAVAHEIIGDHEQDSVVAYLERALSVRPVTARGSVPRPHPKSRAR